jgi:hypothetical protein
MRRVVPDPWLPPPFLVLAALAPAAQGQAPLSIQQLLVGENRWQFSAAFDTASSAFGAFEERSEHALSASLRYGIAPRVEINGSYRMSRRRVRSVAGGAAADARTLELGANWLLRDEDRWPALLLELRATPWADAAGQRAPLSGGSVRVTAYQSIDPVVLSLGLSYACRRGPTAEQAAWRLEPLVSFAVNPRVTLLGGLSYEAQDGPGGPGVLTGTQQLSLRGGLGYAPSRASTLFLIGDLAAGGGPGRLSLQWFHEF